MNKINCWEFKNCGREQGGAKTDEFGICRSSTETILDGVHGGKNAGRACWVVAGTICQGKTQGTFAQKHKNCVQCDFYKTVTEEEGYDVELSVLLSKLRKTEEASNEATKR